MKSQSVLRLLVPAGVVAQILSACSSSDGNDRTQTDVSVLDYFGDRVGGREISGSHNGRVVARAVSSSDAAVTLLLPHGSDISVFAMQGTHRWLTFTVRGVDEPAVDVPDPVGFGKSQLPVAELSIDARVAELGQSYVGLRAGIGGCIGGLQHLERRRQYRYGSIRSV